MWPSEQHKSSAHHPVISHSNDCVVLRKLSSFSTWAAASSGPLDVDISLLSFVNVSLTGWRTATDGGSVAAILDARSSCRVCLCLSRCWLEAGSGACLICDITHCHCNLSSGRLLQLPTSVAMTTTDNNTVRGAATVGDLLETLHPSFTLSLPSSPSPPLRLSLSLSLCLSVCLSVCVCV